MEVAVVSVGGAQLLPVERGRSELVDTLPHAQRVQLPVTSQGWQCWQDCSSAASKTAEDVCMALQVRFDLTNVHTMQSLTETLRLEPIISERLRRLRA